jgi:hypothetical protein
MGVIYLDARSRVSHVPATVRQVCDACGGSGVIEAAALGIVGMAPVDDEEITIPCLACNGTGNLGRHCGTVLPFSLIPQNQNKLLDAPRSQPA